jgi:sugar lactone lactonase YvrE
MRFLVALSINVAFLAAAEAPKLPEKLEPYPVVANISFAEGPTFDSRGNLYFVNYLRNGTIGRMTPDGGLSVWVELPAPAYAFGLKAGPHDELYAADYGGRRLLRISPDRQVTTLADRFQGAPFNHPNDLCLDRDGNVYFTDPQSGAKDSRGSVYRYSRDGKLSLVATDMQYPNGIVADDKAGKLYVTETFTRRIVTLDLATSSRRVLHEFAEPSVDGIALDDYGRLWVARLDYGSVDVLSAAGELLASYPMNGGRVTNLAWWAGRLFVTVSGRHSIYRLDVFKDQGGPPAEPARR